MGHDKATLRRKLDLRLSGIKRPTALVCDEESNIVELLKDHQYMISQLEPLHDLKTTICEFLHCV